MFLSSKCKRCEGILKEAFSFCPTCGLDLRSPDMDSREYGLLGKNDMVQGAPTVGGGALGISDSMIGALFNNVAKMMEQQMKNNDFNKNENEDSKPEVTRLPNGIQIKIGPHMLGKPQPKKQHQHQQRVITDEQRSRMVSLPRAEAKTVIRRFSDHVVYSLDVPGLDSVNDVFVSKVESGYEVKVIGKKKVYVNSLQVNLPIKKYSIKDEQLAIEFGLE